MILWLATSVVQSFTSTCSIQVHTVFTVVNKIRVKNEVDVVALYDCLIPLQSTQELGQRVSDYFSAKLLPLVVASYRKLQEGQKEMLNYQFELEMKSFRDTIECLFSENGRKVVFHEIEANLDSTNPNTITLQERCNNNNSAFVSHIADGQVLFTFTGQDEGSTVGFWDESSDQIIGVEFVKRTRYSNRVDHVRVVDKLYKLGSNSCKVIVSLNFSSTLVVCFQIPSLGIYESVEVPLNSVLVVRLTGSGESCTVSSNL
ncbi:hypothetical protein RCL1_008238 [Eukaryota sp. TZLM3-RCL]